MDQKFEITLSSYCEVSGVRIKKVKALDDLIIDAYMACMENNAGKKGDAKYPDIKEIYKVACKMFCAHEYERFMGVKSDILSEENISIFLAKNLYVFRWGYAICGNSQTEMFPNLVEEDRVKI